MSYAHSARIVFNNMLGTLEHLVAKAQEAGIGESVLAEKLTEDMFPLEMQFRVALNQVLLALNQVAGKKVPLEETAYRTFAEVRRTDCCGSLAGRSSRTERMGGSKRARRSDIAE